MCFLPLVFSTAKAIIWADWQAIRRMKNSFVALVGFYSLNLITRSVEVSCFFLLFFFSQLVKGCQMLSMLPNQAEIKIIITEESVINLDSALHSALSRSRVHIHEKHAEFPFIVMLNPPFQCWGSSQHTGLMSMKMLFILLWATGWNTLVQPSGSVNNKLSPLTFLN